MMTNTQSKLVVEPGVNKYNTLIFKTTIGWLCCGGVNPYSRSLSLEKIDNYHGDGWSILHKDVIPAMYVDQWGYIKDVTSEQIGFDGDKSYYIPAVITNAVNLSEIVFAINNITDDQLGKLCDPFYTEDIAIKW